MPKLYRTRTGQASGGKFVEEEFRIVKEPDTTRTSLVHSKRISE